MIVDAYSTGASLADELKLYGITCVHVQTSAEILEYDVDSYKPEDFQQRFVATQDLKALTDKLAEFEPAFIIPGCESGVELADQLSELMGTPGNGTALSACRRDKWHMAKRLHQMGIPAARVALIHQTSEVEAATETIDGWPVVIKPVNSAGADGIHFCYEMAQVRHAVDKELGRLNEMGLINDTLLAMEYLAGQQYLVQAVSRDGEHFVFEIWRDNRKPVPGAGVVNDREVLIDLLSEEAAPSSLTFTNAWRHSASTSALVPGSHGDGQRTDADRVGSPDDGDPGAQRDDSRARRQRRQSLRGLLYRSRGVLFDAG
ncbi:hypothetical protein THH46_10950 [Pseudomonas sp. NA13]